MTGAWKTAIGLGWILLVCLSAGCGEDGSPGVVNPFQIPQVTGIYILDENADVIGVWGQPAEGGLLAFPDPADVFAMHFTILASTRVRMWVSQAAGPGESTDPGWDRSSGGEVVVPSRSAVRTLLDQSLPAGDHQVVWDGRYDDFSPAPGGFYRIYARLGEYSVFGDVFLWRPGDPIPPGLERWLQY